METTKYNWKITAKKFGWALLEVLILGGIAYAIKTPELMLALPFLEATKNWLKNKNK